MTIAVNACFLDDDHLTNNGNFIIECFSRLAKKFPQHRFLFISDKAINQQYISANNILPVIAGPKIKNPLLLQYWLNFKVPAILRKHKADVFVSIGYCSQRTKLPQCLVINELSFLHHPQFFTRSWFRFYKKNTPGFLNKATIITTAAQFLKQDIIETYKIHAGKIDVVYQSVNKIFTQADWQQKEIIKEEYTSGKEYFLYTGEINSNKNLVNLLKAFSFFKKRQKSNMQLVLATTTVFTDAAFAKSLAAYKYRDEIMLLDKLRPETLAAITAAAYALVYPVFYDGFCTPALEAMQTGVPVITSNKAAMPEICGNAALYINPDDFNDIADKMMLLFKDENKRNELIVSGLEQVTKYNWPTTTELLWQAIEKCNTAV
jgi:glycosyltransferase involved in cell wall biosynthesis